jgi:murein DD-endopeptidase MepM/ murein hydrolase activator NlpD
MVTNSAPAVVVASAAILLATSVTPSGRAAVLPPAAVVTAPVTAAGTSEAAGAPTSAPTPGPAGTSVREGLVERAHPVGAAPRAGPARGDGGAAPVRGATRPEASSAAVRGMWRWPVLPRPPVARPFRAPLTTYGAGHRGLDLAVADGTPVLAVEGGVVTHAGFVAGRGTVTMAHQGGLSSTYEPVDPLVAVGAVVVTGQTIGVLRVRAGPRHCGTRPCLHLGARRGAAYLDPYPLLAGGRVALLPLGG